jgi:hypothetical protein
MTGSTLSVEQRQALAMLAIAGLNGATQLLLSGRGFGASLVVGLVNRGLVTIMYERVRGRRNDGRGHEGADHGRGAEGD